MPLAAWRWRRQACTLLATGQHHSHTQVGVPVATSISQHSVFELKTALQGEARKAATAACCWSGAIVLQGLPAHQRVRAVGSSSCV